MASGVNQYHVLNEDTENVFSDAGNVQQQYSTSFNPRSPWNWNQQTNQSPLMLPSRSPVRNVIDTSTSDGITLSPDRFLASGYLHQSDDNFAKRETHLPTKLPSWLWRLLSYTLGIDPGKRLSFSRLGVSTFLHVLTLSTAFCYGACGLIFNFYDTLSEFTRTTALVCIAKSAIGMFWILLGTYSHPLASRLFNNHGLLGYIRLHSKTFMKISTVAWILVLGISVTVLNFYSNVYLLHESSNETQYDITDADCHGVGLPVILCQIYFSSKIIFSCLNLSWNLIVTAVCLSVCRTHTICLRRFMKELSYDSKIYEEFYTLKTCRPDAPSEFLARQFSEYDICDDFTNTEDEESGTRLNGENVLQTLRTMRTKKLSHSASIVSSSRPGRDPERFNSRQNSEDENDLEVLREVEMKECPQDHDYQETGPAAESSGVFEDSQNEAKFSSMKAPIMSNEDLMFTYFKIMKHLRATSRLLQRWMSSWIIFVMMWCTMLIIYWVSHTATLNGIYQFLAPLIVLGLLISAYAEVNFESQRFIKFILPTEDRMSVIYYINNTPLELKVYSFVMSYNVLVTVVAGVAVTIATRIVLNNML